MAERDEVWTRLLTICQQVEKSLDSQVVVAPQPVVDLLPDKPACTCTTCVSMCKHRPCWPTPQEAEKLMELGYGDRLTEDYWVGDLYDGSDGDIYILSPAIKGQEGKVMGFVPKGECTFLQDRRCTLHALGLKPYEGRAVDHTPVEELANPHYQIAYLWNNPQAQALVTRWREVHRAVDEV